MFTIFILKKSSMFSIFLFYRFKMEKAINEKMDSLLKYVPFIDFILSIDKKKYTKFTNIRKWIILKGKKYVTA